MTIDPTAFWDDFYGGQDAAWSGRPNAALVRETGSFAPGSALDLGCGEGADAIWLARRGWRVVGVDIAQAALDQARVHADEAGVREGIEWHQHDLVSPLPFENFDLVTAMFLHAPFAMPTEDILRAGVAAVAPGGHFLQVNHDQKESRDAGLTDVCLPSPDEMLAALRLDMTQWRSIIVGAFEKATVDSDGIPMSRTDNIVVVQRVSGAGCEPFSARSERELSERVLGDRRHGF
jgi:SAM-dependent methyltransferase